VAAKLSTRQRQIVTFVDEFCRERGYPPSLMDIGRGVGLVSKSSVKYQVDRLVAFGVLVRDPLLTRTIRVAAHTTSLSNDRAASGTVRRSPSEVSNPENPTCRNGD
jgi:SOS-response transcriptional repressor LexA